MKKSLIALAALAATGAFAQSSVVLSGVMDAALTYGSNVAPGAPTLSVGRQNNNRLNFNVTEDLGGGMAATVALGLRFEPNTGNVESGVRPLFQGESRVGISGSFGRVRLGRGLTAVQQPNGGMIDPWGVTTVAGSLYAVGFSTDYAAGGEGRTDGIFYDSPTMGGVAFALTYSPRKTATGVTTGAAPATTYGKTFVSTAVTYVAGPVQAMLGYEQNRQGDSLLQLGGNYDLGAAKLFAGYGNVKGGSAADRATVAFASTSGGYPLTGAQNATGTGATATQVAAGTTITTWTLGASIPMGATTFRAGYSSYASDIAGALRDSKLGLGVSYALSKRTYVYSDIASTSRNNNPATTVNNPAYDNSRVTAFDLGIAHSF